MEGKIIQPLQVDATTASTMLGISRSKFYSALSSGRIPLVPSRIGSKSLFSVEELRRYVEAKCPAADEWRRSEART